MLLPLLCTFASQAEFGARYSESNYIGKSSIRLVANAQVSKPSFFCSAHARQKIDDFTLISRTFYH